MGAFRLSTIANCSKEAAPRFYAITGTGVYLTTVKPAPHYLFAFLEHRDYLMQTRKGSG